MSDFDKEAEREKLRKQYEREERKREATEQMSELLLQGATMTNAHCSDCGDPIFRYDGQEFCPTCQKPVDRGSGSRSGGSTETGEDGGTEADDNSATGDNIEVTTPSDDATVRFGSDDNEETTNDQPETTDEGPTNEGGPNRSATRPTGDSPPESTRSTSTSSDDGQQARRPPTASVSEHLDRAQVVLAGTVEAFARRAAETESPREAREHLEAARDAAETLDAIGL